jgi:hypothetical protein
MPDRSWKRLHSVGADVRAQLLEHVSHATIVAALASPVRALAPVRRDVTDFLSA